MPARSRRCCLSSLSRSPLHLSDLQNLLPLRPAQSEPPLPRLASQWLPGCPHALHPHVLPSHLLFSSPPSRSARPSSAPTVTPWTWWATPCRRPVRTCGTCCCTASHRRGSRSSLTSSPVTASESLLSKQCAGSSLTSRKEGTQYVVSSRPRKMTVFPRCALHSSYALRLLVDRVRSLPPCLPPSLPPPAISSVLPSLQGRQGHSVCGHEGSSS